MEDLSFMNVDDISVEEALKRQEENSPKLFNLIPQPEKTKEVKVEKTVRQKRVKTELSQLEQLIIKVLKDNMCYGKTGMRPKWIYAELKIYSNEYVQKQISNKVWAMAKSGTLLKDGDVYSLPNE